MDATETLNALRPPYDDRCHHNENGVKKRRIRQVRVLPGESGRDNFCIDEEDYGESGRDDFCIDEEDYLILSNLLGLLGIPEYKIERLVRQSVSIRENDEERRVYKIALNPFWTHSIVSLRRFFNASIAKLKNLTKLTHLEEFPRIDNIAIPPSIGLLQNLQNLDLSSINGVNLPDEIRALVNLVTLELGVSRIGSLPFSIGRLKHLKELILHFKYSEQLQLPDEMGALVRLVTTLKLNKEITSLPPSIGRMKNLKELNLSHTHFLKQLCVEIGALANLVTLNLHRSGVESLPSSIRGLQNLKELNLSHTYFLQQLPDSIGELANLANLDLRVSSRIKSLPTSIGQLQNLNELNLRRSTVGLLPPAIGQLRNLKNLDLGLTRHLSTLPEAIGDLTNLERLCLCGSDIRSLPASIGRLENLEVLNLQYTSKLTLKDDLPTLASLPDSMVKLTNLKQLRLYEYRRDFVRLGKKDCEFLLRLTRSCRLLIELGDGFDHARYKNLAPTHALVAVRYEVGCNRARLEMGYGGKEAIHWPLKLWPLVLTKASIPFQHDADAVYRILADGRESFLEVLCHRPGKLL